MNNYYESKDESFKLFKGDCKKIISSLDGKFDMVFAEIPLIFFLVVVIQLKVVK